MKAIARRLRRLEDLSGVLESPKRMRLVICAIGQSLDLSKSTCRRRLDRSGVLTEIVELQGSAQELTDEQLEKFVQSFPVEGASPPGEDAR